MPTMQDKSYVVPFPSGVSVRADAFTDAAQVLELRIDAALKFVEDVERGNREGRPGLTREIRRGIQELSCQRDNLRNLALDAFTREMGSQEPQEPAKPAAKTLRFDVGKLFDLAHDYAREKSYLDEFTRNQDQPFDWGQAFEANYRHALHKLLEAKVVD